MNQATGNVYQNAHSGPEQWRERGELIELLGHSLFIIDESPSQGANNKVLPTILLLHGFPTSSWDWQPM